MHRCTHNGYLSPINTPIVITVSVMIYGIPLQRRRLQHVVKLNSLYIPTYISIDHKHWNRNNSLFPIDIFTDMLEFVPPNSFRINQRHYQSL